MAGLLLLLAYALPHRSPQHGVDNLVLQPDRGQFRFHMLRGRRDVVGEIVGEPAPTTLPTAVVDNILVFGEQVVGSGRGGWRG